MPPHLQSLPFLRRDWSSRQADGVVVGDEVIDNAAVVGAEEGLVGEEAEGW